jgi:hypothetical protein
MPSRESLVAASRAWGNPAWSANLHYLVETCQQASKAEGPILECGSGLTTFLLGVLAARRGLEVWSLEHERSWHERVRAWLDRARVDNVHLCHAPLRAYDGFEWYERPKGHVPHDFALVICDGPPSETGGGRYGLLPVMASALTPDCVILLDDAERDSEMETLRRWQKGWHVSFQRYGLDHPPAHAVVRLPSGSGSPRPDGESEAHTQAGT